MEQVHDGRRHLELLLAAGLVAASRRGLFLRDYRHLEPLLEVLQKLLAQFLAEHVAEQLGQEGEPLDQGQVEVPVVPEVHQHGPDHLVHHLHVDLEPGNEGFHALKTCLRNLRVGGLEAFEEDCEDLVSVLRDVVARGQSPECGLPQGHEVDNVLVAGELLEAGVVLLAQRGQLGHEHAVLHHLDVDGEEAGAERGAERVPVHQPDLSIDWLVSQ